MFKCFPMYFLELGCIEAFMLFQVKWDFCILLGGNHTKQELGPEECFLSILASIASLQVRSKSKRFIF